MTNKEIIEKSVCGFSEDIDGKFYTLYDANKICELKDEQYKWHNVSEELPDKSKRLQIYICQIVDTNGQTKDPLLCRYFRNEFVNHITLDSLHYGDNVIAWMELPEYKNK